MKRTKWNWYAIIGWLIAFTISVVLWTSFAIIVVQCTGCTKEFSREQAGVPPAPPAGCYYLKLLKVPTDFNGNYAYVADFYQSYDTAVEYGQFNVRYDDTTYWQQHDRTTLCNLFFERKTSTVLIR